MLSYPFVFLVAGATFARKKAGKASLNSLTKCCPPNETRSASGALGPKYWQQQADYVINAELNDVNQSVPALKRSYTNNSPDPLKGCLWVQLDQNINERDNNTQNVHQFCYEQYQHKTIAGNAGLYDFDGGFKLKSCRCVRQSIAFTSSIKRWCALTFLSRLQPAKKFFQSTGHLTLTIVCVAQHPTMAAAVCGVFPKDGNYLYIIAQWFPRMCVYDDLVGWQNKQFLGQGEFTLSFGNYQVNLTVPADHVVAGTGMVQNLQKFLLGSILTFREQNFVRQAGDHLQPAGSDAAWTEKSTQKKTWKFKADNVRDFAFATSRKFIWDTQAVKNCWQNCVNGNVLS